MAKQLLLISILFIGYNSLATSQVTGSFQNIVDIDETDYASSLIMVQ